MLQRTSDLHSTRAKDGTASRARTGDTWFHKPDDIPIKTTTYALVFHIPYTAGGTITIIRWYRLLGSNQRHPAPQAGALPTELRRRTLEEIYRRGSGRKPTRCRPRGTYPGTPTEAAASYSAAFNCRSMASAKSWSARWSGNRWPYTFIVISMREWPRKRCTFLGAAPAAISAEAAKWRPWCGV
jgi:hypothetical protein